MLLFVGAASSLALPTLRSASLIGVKPIALATACPDGRFRRQPRSRLRSASTDGFEATDSGNEPSGFTREVSILYAGWTRFGPSAGGLPLLKNKFQSMAQFLGNFLKPTRLSPVALKIGRRSIDWLSL